MSDTNSPATAPYNFRNPLPGPAAISMNNGGPGSGQPATLPVPGVELGQIAAGLARTLRDRYAAPPDDPIHAHVEIVHCLEMSVIYAVNALQTRSQREGQVIAALETATTAIGGLASEERRALAEDITKARDAANGLTEAAKATRAAYDETRPKIDNLPILQEALEADVTARARERWGHNVILVIVALLFLAIGIAATAYFFTKFVLPRVAGAAS